MKRSSPDDDAFGRVVMWLIAFANLNSINYELHLSSLARLRFIVNCLFDLFGNLSVSVHYRHPHLNAFLHAIQLTVKRITVIVKAYNTKFRSLAMTLGDPGLTTYAGRNAIAPVAIRASAVLDPLIDNLQQYWIALVLELEPNVTDEMHQMVDVQRLEGLTAYPGPGFWSPPLRGAMGPPVRTTLAPVPRTSWRTVLAPRSRRPTVTVYSPLATPAPVVSPVSLPVVDVVVPQLAFTNSTPLVSPANALTYTVTQPSAVSAFAVDTAQNIQATVAQNVVGALANIVPLSVLYSSSSATKGL